MHYWSSGKLVVGREIVPETGLVHPFPDLPTLTRSLGPQPAPNENPHGYVSPFGLFLSVSLLRRISDGPSHSIQRSDFVGPAA